MNYFEPKDYQKQVLYSISQYFEMCRELKDPNLAFYKMTGVSYQPLKGFVEGMSYFCLRVPTGGGKTWLAATSIQLINHWLLHTEHSVILWLVPSNQIKEQTLQGLKDREHPLHAALLTVGAMTVLSLDKVSNDRVIGELWASLSHGRCHFIMVINSRFDWLDSLLSAIS